MLGNYEHELICDFAQYYRITDWKELPVDTAAILACGLPSESRVLKALNKQKVDINIMLEAVIADKVSQLVWFQTKDGRKHRNRPKSYTKMLMQTSKAEKSERSFRSGEEFEAARRRIIEGN